MARRGGSGRGASAAVRSGSAIVIVLILAIGAAVAAIGATGHRHPTPRPAPRTSPSASKPAAFPQPLPVALPAVVTSARFPTAVYPVPNTVQRDGYPQCPSLLGVQRRPTLDPAAYVGLISDFGHPSLRNDLRRADRAMWPLILAADTNPQTPQRRQVMPTVDDRTQGIHVTTIRRGDRGRRAAVRTCGAALVNRSVAVRIGPGDGVTRSDFWVLRRGGRLLLWGWSPSMYAGGSFFVFRSQHASSTLEPLEPCSLTNGGTSTSFTAHENEVQITVHNRRGGLPNDGCSLTGWAGERVQTATYRESVALTASGRNTPVILWPGQKATFDIRALACPGPRRTYTGLRAGYAYLAIYLRLGPCGAAVTSYHLASSRAS